MSEWKSCALWPHTDKTEDTNEEFAYSEYYKALLDFTIELLSEAVEVMELMHSLDNWDDAYRHLAEYLTKLKEK